MSVSPLELSLEIVRLLLNDIGEYSGQYSLHLDPVEPVEPHDWFWHAKLGGLKSGYLLNIMVWAKGDSLFFIASTKGMEVKIDSRDWSLPMDQFSARYLEPMAACLANSIAGAT